METFIIIVVAKYWNTNEVVIINVSVCAKVLAADINKSK